MAENYLKCLLECLEIQTPRTHDLQALATLLPPAWLLPVSMARLAEMNPYAVNIRYADDWLGPSLQDARRALALAKEIYAEAYAHREELCAPYATVIDIDVARLPTPEVVAGWSSEQFTSALRHDQNSASYNSSLRQLLHVGFKVAAKLGSRYIDLLERNEAVIAKNVTGNLYDRHIVPIFLGGRS